jgi:hypothetical protein
VVEPCPSQIDLLFSGGFINKITVSGTYHINVNAPPVGITYVWTANYYDINNVSISAVVGAGTTGTQSNFTIDLLTMPSNAEYVFYVCTSNEGVHSVISIGLVQASAPCPPDVFNLDFSGLESDTIIANGVYKVSVNPVGTNGETYTYTADFYHGVTNLGAVPGFGVSGTDSSFTIDLATVPGGVNISNVYIKYTCTASGSIGQGGHTAEIILAIIEPCPVCPSCDSCCPVCPDSDNVELIRATTGNIEFNQINADESLKLLSTKNLGELKMSLVDSYGSLLHTDKPVYYECQLEATNRGGSVLTDS